MVARERLPAGTAGCQRVDRGTSAELQSGVGKASVRYACIPSTTITNGNVRAVLRLTHASQCNCQCTAALSG